MRSFFYYLLGQVLALALLLPFVNAADCYQLFYLPIKTGTVPPNNATQAYTSIGWDGPSDSSVTFGQQHLIVSPAPYRDDKWILQRWTGTTWTNAGGPWDITCDGSVSVSGALAVTALTQSAFKAAKSSCSVPQDCPDSDSDGVCDVCDAAPYDSTEGPDTYLHGYYTYGGKVVAVQHGGSSNKDNGYYTTVLDRTTPGAVIGGTGGIDEETFIEAGGQYRALQQAEKVMSTSCPEVTDLNQCVAGGFDCLHETTDAGKDEDLGDFEEVQPEMSGGETMPPGPDDLYQDDPYLDTPDRDCPSYSSLCTNSCGGSPLVARFACTEFDGGKKNVACECTNEGGYWTSPDYGTGFDESSQGEDGNPDADDIENQGHSTGSNTIDSDTGTGGQPTDADNDGDIDGYEQGDRVVDFGPLMTGTGSIASKFPFNLVTSMKELGNQFIASPECPSFSLPVWDQTITFDLCAFNGVAAIVRNLFGILLTAACFWGVIKFFM